MIVTIRKRITSAEAQAAHRIYNQVSQTAGGYYGHVVYGHARDMVSRNRWIMFPIKSVTSLKEAKQTPAPNVYIHFGDNIKDDGKGNCEATIGLTYDNVGAMAWLGHILKKFPDELEEALAPMDVWTAHVGQKVVVDAYGTTPGYDGYKEWAAEEVTADEITQAIKDQALPVNLAQKGSLYDVDHVVLHAHPFFQIYIESTLQDFPENIKEIFVLFDKLLSLRWGHLCRSSH